MVEDVWQQKGGSSFISGWNRQKVAWPSGLGIILQDFQERFEGGTLYKTTPSGFMASIMLLAQVGQVAADRLSTDSSVESAIKSWTAAELEQDAKFARHRCLRLRF